MKTFPNIIRCHIDIIINLINCENQPVRLMLIG